VAGAYADDGIGIAVVLAQRCEKAAAAMERAGVSYPFPVLCDEDRAVIRRYGVWHPVGLDYSFNTTYPASFLVDAPTRRLRYSFVGRTQFARAPLAAILRAAQETGSGLREPGRAREEPRAGA
jgi:peroxiredoxin